MAHKKPKQVVRLNRTIRGLIQEYNDKHGLDAEKDMEFEIYKEPYLGLSIDLMDRETLVVYCKYLCNLSEKRSRPIEADVVIVEAIEEK